MSFFPAAALSALLCSLLLGGAAAAQEAVKPIPQEPTPEERAAARESMGGATPQKTMDAPKDAAKMSAPPKPVPQEPTKEERAAVQGDQPSGEPITAAEWARQQRKKEGLAVSEEEPPPPPQVPREEPATVPHTAAEWAAQAGKPKDTALDKEAERSLVQGAPGLSVGFGSPAVDAPGGLASAAPAPKHVLELSGYAILGASWIQQDSTLVYVGRNNGFQLADARIELTARPADSVWLFLSLDGAVASVNPSDRSQGTRDVKLKDAYAIWAPGNHLRVQAGQFKAPQGVEELLEETDIKFASRSILSTGVDAPIGYLAEPLSIGRQLGAGIGTDRIELGPGGLTAQLAVMNGNGADQLYNDAPYPSVAVRGAYDAHGISIGIFGSFQPRALGSKPLVYRDNVFNAGVDVLVKHGALHALVTAQLRKTRHVTGGQQDEAALGVSGEAAYRFGFIEPALRVSYLDPSDKIDTDALLYTTAGVNLYVPGAPGRLSIDFTHRIEQSGRELSNDGIEASAQVRF